MSMATPPQAREGLAVPDRVPESVFIGHGTEVLSVWHVPFVFRGFTVSIASHHTAFAQPGACSASFRSGASLRNDSPLRALPGAHAAVFGLLSFLTCCACLPTHLHPTQAHPYYATLWMYLLWPLTLPIVLGMWLWGSVFVADKHSIGDMPVETWCMPALGARSQDEAAPLPRPPPCPLLRLRPRGAVAPCLRRPPSRV